ncbi:hypothetical protein B566_EDAN006680 [Ephemera danica]|nr:hypothetical protein B566_EDAN006680 [Ephemera danica]
MSCGEKCRGGDEAARQIRIYDYIRLDLNGVELTFLRSVAYHLTQQQLTCNDEAEPGAKVFACECIQFTSTFGKPAGVFSSPDFPRSYEDNIECLLYSFVARRDQIVEITFREFDVQKTHLEGTLCWRKFNGFLRTKIGTPASTCIAKSNNILAVDSLSDNRTTVLSQLKAEKEWLFVHRVRKRGKVPGDYIGLVSPIFRKIDNA